MGNIEYAIGLLPFEVVTMPSRRFALCLCALALLTTSVAEAAGAKVDPKLARALATGIIGPWHRRPPVPGRASVLVELTGPADATAIEALRAAGAAVTVVEGKLLAYD